MLKEIRQELINQIQTELGSLAKVDRYRGEFEEGSEWYPTPTACFIQIVHWKPISKSPQGETLRSASVLRVYAGGKITPAGEGTDIVEQVVTLLDGNTLTLTIDGTDYALNMSIPDEGMDLILAEKGFEGYAFNLYLQ